MCLPLAAAGAFLTSATGMATVAVATSAASIISQAQVAAAQNKAIAAQAQQAYAQNAVEKQAQINDRLRAARREDANITVAAGEAGLSLGSGSIETLLMNTQMQTAQTGDRIDTNTSFKNQEVANGANRSFSNVSNPSLLGAGLQLASAGLNGYAQGSALQLQRAAMSKAAATSVTG